MNAAVGTSKRSRIQLSRSEEEEESEEDFVDTPFKPVQHGVLEQEVSTAEGGPAATAMTTTISYALMKRPLFPLKSRAFDATQYAIEAKIGVYLDKHTSRRWNPMMTNLGSTPSFVATHTIGGSLLEGVMESDMIYRFQASVLPEHHKLLNMKLNELVVKSSSLERDTRWQEKKASSLEEYPPLLIKYKHEKSRDSFYDHPTLGKLRATFKKASTNTINDAKTPASHSRDHEELKYVLQKKRISDLAILFPLFPFDVRISVNQEIPIKLREEELGQLIQSRMKDRMSYSIQDQYVVDLTRVDTVVNRGDSDKLNSNFNTSTNKSTTFEVEVELLDPNRHPDDSAELLVSTIRSLLSSAST